MKKGQSLIELLFIISLLAVLLPILFTGFVSSRDGRVQQNQRLTGTSILKETEEAVRNVRENDWSSFAAKSNAGPFYPAIDPVTGYQWMLLTGAESLSNGFTRKVVITDVYRNTFTGPIVDASFPGAVLDPSIKKVAMTISWQKPYPSSIESFIFLSRWLENATYTETTQTQFNAGTKSGTAVRASAPQPIPTPDDGEVILGAGGHSDWCSPQLDSHTLDLPKNGVANALYAIPGKAFATTGENSSGVSFAQVNITDTFPPVPSINSTLDGYKTNGVFGDSNYAYITTDSNSKHGIIIDINQIVDGKFVEVGYLDAETSSDAKSIYVSGNNAYLTVSDTFYSFDISNKSGRHTKLNSINLDGTGNSVVINGNYAYIAVGSGSTRLQIINVTNPASMSDAGSINIDASGAQDVYVSADGSRAYIVTSQSSTKNEFFIINTANKSTPTLVTGGAFNTSPMDPKALTLVPGN